MQSIGVINKVGYNTSFIDFIAFALVPRKSFL